MTITLNDIEYELACNLRVAYELQNKNNHKPYNQVFAELGEAPLEKQIELIYVSFKLANPNELMTSNTFLNYFLDNYDVSYILDVMEYVMAGVMGKKFADRLAEIAPLNLESHLENL